MWMIYGAYGYTGQLTAELAVQQGLRPILAGRSAEKLAPLAERLGLEQRVFSLDEPAHIERNLKDIDLVMHHAGPFSSTSRPMVDACLATSTHYLDITGEIPVFEAVLSRDREAKEANIVLMPGVGFDVVPTDCMAAMLARALPDATHLELAFMGLGGGMSAGTSKTMVEGLGLGGAARIKGRIRSVPSAWKSREISFPSKTLHCITIPWGDVSTAYHTTGIPNICTYTAIRPKHARVMRKLDRMSKIFQNKRVQKGLKRLVEWRVKGPDEKARAKASSEIWGEVRNDAGEVVTGSLRTPEGYTLTAMASLAIASRVLLGDIPAGALTPAKALGADFISTLEGVEVFPLQRSHS